MNHIINYENLKEVNRPFFEELQKEFTKVLNSGWYILGENVQKFEESFSNYLGLRNSVGVNSGLDALIISLLAVKKFDSIDKDEVIVPSNTYIATILAIIKAGLKPVLVEPDIKTYNIDPKKIEERITKKTKAILVVHLYGKSCEMDMIKKIAKKENLFILEDCAQSHGAMFKGQKTGTFGDFGAFSFYPTKNLGALGDGGLISISNNEHDEYIRSIRNYGSGEKYINENIGLNSRLDEIQAAFLNVKLQYLDKLNEYKRKLAKIYLQNLKEDFIKPIVDEDYYDVYHIFNIRHDKRDILKAYLLKHGVKTEVHYPISPNNQPAYKEILKGSCPVSEIIHNTTLSLPISYSNSEDDIYKVIEIMNGF